MTGIVEITKSRKDFALITNWVQPNSKVLDLGCGDGSLLAHLEKVKQTRGYGVEKDDKNWLAALKNDVNVIQMNLEDGLSEFEDNAFDTVILSQTLQAMHNTEGIVLDMLRVGREAIVTFPNFGYWQNRLQIMTGNMPVSKNLPHQWYNTPNVHLCTINDFEQFCQVHGIAIIERNVMTDNKPVTLFPNWLGNLAIYRLKSS